MTAQPKWKLVANLGDASPLDYGGLFVYEDETGVYPPEMEKLELVNEDDDDIDPYEVAANAWIEAASKRELVELCELHELYADCENLVPFTEDDDVDHMADVVRDYAIDAGYEEFCKEHGIEVDEYDDGREYMVYRVVLDKFKMKDGYVDEWFDWPPDEGNPRDVSGLQHVAHSYGMECIGVDELREDLCGDDTMRRALAYECIYGYHGWDNGDAYPLTLNHREVIERYKADLEMLREKQ